MRGGPTSQFLNKLRTEQDSRQFALLADLSLMDDAQGQITALAGFVSNYASLSAFHNILLFVIYALLIT